MMTMTINAKKKKIEQNIKNIQEDVLVEKKVFAIVGSYLF